MHDQDNQTDLQTPDVLTVTDRARIRLEELHRRADLPPGMTLAIQPGDDEYVRFASKRPDATDRVAIRQEDGTPLLVVPAPAVEALAGAVLDFVVAPEPGFIVMP
jgi:hypothetical protein